MRKYARTSLIACVLTWKFDGSKAHDFYGDRADE